MRTSSETQLTRAGTPVDNIPTGQFLPADTTQVVDAFIRVLEGLYAHLPLKRAMYGIDPVQQLRRLKQRLGTLDDNSFNREIGDIIRSLRDAHTVYVGPAHLAGKVARLPFLVEQYGPPNQPRYMVSKVAPELVDDPAFVEGVELEWWNGVPIATAIDTRARQERGGRIDSGRARAVESLTFRPLRYEPPPDEQWVVVGYLTNDGDTKEVRIPWSVIEPGTGPAPIHSTSPAAAAVAVNPGAADVRRAKKLMFNQTLWRHEDSIATANVGTDAAGNISGRFADNVSARIRTTKAGTFGHLRLWGFDLADDDGFVEEVIEILRLLPPDGLIIDLRANPGGLIWAAERLLQLFTPAQVAPTQFSLLATDATRALAEVRQNQAILGAWLPSLTAAISTGELYSQALPITPVQLCNNIGQVYGGPVVAIVDATTYSAGDLFAAGFVDNEIGTLVTVGEATGAGGANVWSAETLAALTSDSPIEFRLLPAGAGFTVSIRRATRTGPSAGLPIEDVGVAGHRRYSLTHRDLLESNQDLLDYCGQILAATPTTDLTIDTDQTTLTITTKGLTLIDIYVDGHPAGPPITPADPTPITMQLPGYEERLEVCGYQGSILRQRRTVQR